MTDGPATTGFNHVATMTADLDRYLTFYSDIFGAEVINVTDHGDHPRMAVVNMGGDSALNVFEAVDTRQSRSSETGPRWVDEGRSTITRWLSTPRRS
jgi:catechol 2,3-dioxygenase-like lactoylglutathione lyase family enzyme